MCDNFFKKYMRLYMSRMAFKNMAVKPIIDSKA